VHELLNAQDTVLCSYFVQRSLRSGERGEGCSRKSTVEEGWTDLNKIWRGTVGRKMGRMTTRGKYKRVSELLAKHDTVHPAELTYKDLGSGKL
jgi:hypothetical protein